MDRRCSRRKATDHGSLYHTAVGIRSKERQFCLYVPFLPTKVFEALVSLNSDPGVPPTPTYPCLRSTTSRGLDYFVLSAIATCLCAAAAERRNTAHALVIPAPLAWVDEERHCMRPNAFMLHRVFCILK